MTCVFIAGEAALMEQWYSFAIGLCNLCGLLLMLAREYVYTQQKDIIIQATPCVRVAKKFNQSCRKQLTDNAEGAVDIL